jgi:hypothetical protein
MFRLDGTYRLASVIEHESENFITFTNNFKFIDLHKEGISAARYANRYVWGIPDSLATSTGASGPGGPYISFGLLGVMLAYWSMGIIYRIIYSMMEQQYSDFYIALNAYMSMSLIYIWPETLNFMTLLKKLLIITVIIWIAKKYFKRN